MNKSLLFHSLFFFVIFCTGCVSASKTERPNIIIFFADDLGYADVGYHGIRDVVKTPNIDSIASSGVQFSQGYVTCSVCAPSRAALMTGRYQQRWGYDDCPGAIRRDPNYPPGIHRDQLLLSEYLKPLGYATAHIGKQHDGQSTWCNPYRRGFDYFHGYYNTGHGYFLEDNFASARKLGEEYRVDGLFWENDKPLSEPPKGYITDRYGDMACEWVREQCQEDRKPFFLYLPFSAVHGHVEAKPEHIQLFKTQQLADQVGGSDVPKAEQRIRKHAELLGCVYAMDEAIGRVLTTLDELKVRDNTMIIFISDNGGQPDWWNERQQRWEGNFSRNTPLRGGKATMFEGGHRVPFCMSWPGHITPGSRYDKPICTIDIVPTVLAAVGINANEQPKPFDGVDLLPYLSGQKDGRPHTSLYWRFSPGWAIRHEDWKLVQTRSGEPLMLFDLANDPGEKNDLASKMPEKAAELQRRYNDWNQEMMPAMWGRDPRNGIHGNYRLVNYKVTSSVPEDKRLDLKFESIK